MTVRTAHVAVRVVAALLRESHAASSADGPYYQVYSGTSVQPEASSVYCHRRIGVIMPVKYLPLLFTNDVNILVFHSRHKSVEFPHLLHTA